MIIQITVEGRNFGEEYTGAGVALAGMSPGYAERRFLDLYASWA